MPCFVLLLALLAPRLTLFLLWFFSHYLNRAYETVLWPVVGFFFMPITTVAYAVARNEGGGLHDGWLVLYVVAVLLDLGVIGTARSRPREKQ